MTADYAFASHPMCPYHEPSEDSRDRARRALDVAERHFRTVSPEFVEWLDGQLSMQEQAALLVGVLEYTQLRTGQGIARKLRREWLEYAATIPSELCSEIAREP